MWREAEEAKLEREIMDWRRVSGRKRASEVVKYGVDKVVSPAS